MMNEIRYTCKTCGRDDLTDDETFPVYKSQRQKYPSLKGCRACESIVLRTR